MKMKKAWAVFVVAVFFFVVSACVFWSGARTPMAPPKPSVQQEQKVIELKGLGEGVERAFRGFGEHMFPGP